MKLYLFCLIITVNLSFYGCNSDCNGVVCFNGAECIDGECICPKPEGHTSFCEAYNKQLVGAWKAQYSTGCVGISYDDFINIVAGETPDEIIIKLVYMYDGYGLNEDLSIEAIVNNVEVAKDGKITYAKFTIIPFSFAGDKQTGHGVIQGSTLTFTINNCQSPLYTRFF